MPIIAHRRDSVSLGTPTSRVPNGVVRPICNCLMRRTICEARSALCSRFDTGGFMEISGNTFLVTGGASGLGAATARVLVSAGGNAVLADVNVSEGEALARTLGARAVFVRTDVTDEASAKADVRTALERFGALAGAING